MTHDHGVQAISVWRAVASHGIIVGVGLPATRPAPQPTPFPVDRWEESHLSESSASSREPPIRLSARASLALTSLSSASRLLSCALTRSASSLYSSRSVLRFCQSSGAFLSVVSIVIVSSIVVIIILIILLLLTTTTTTTTTTIILIIIGIIIIVVMCVEPSAS
jgi:hypothetical protein